MNEDLIVAAADDVVRILQAAQRPLTAREIYLESAYVNALKDLHGVLRWLMKDHRITATRPTEGVPTMYAATAQPGCGDADASPPAALGEGASAPASSDTNTPTAPPKPSRAAPTRRLPTTRVTSQGKRDAEISITQGDVRRALNTGEQPMTVFDVCSALGFDDDRANKGVTNALDKLKAKGQVLSRKIRNPRKGPAWINSYSVVQAAQAPQQRTRPAPMGQRPATSANTTSPAPTGRQDISTKTNAPQDQATDMPSTPPAQESQSPTIRIRVSDDAVERMRATHAILSRLTPSSPPEISGAHEHRPGERDGACQRAHHEDPTAVDELRIAVWLDGAMIIARGSTEVHLEPDEVARMLRLADAAASAAAPGAVNR